MPIYLFSCERCGKELETVQGYYDAVPLCCGEPMNHLPTCPSQIKIKGTHSKGYKEGYAKDYRRRLAESKS